MRTLLGSLIALLLLAGCAEAPGDGADRPARDGGEEATAAQPREDAATLSNAAPKVAPRATVVAVGDIACPVGKPARGNKCRQAATARVARNLHPDAVLGLGDLQYERGNLASFRGSYDKSWGRLRGITWSVPGNHEYRTPGARGYYRYFAGRPGGKRPGYYRRTINGWQIYLVNSNCSEVDCAQQRTWLYRQMFRHPSKCSLIAMHHPRYSSGYEHGNAREAVGFWRVAQQFGTDVAVAGHDHDYERFAPMDNKGRVRANGIQSFVSGAGGKNLYRKGKHVRGSRVFYNGRAGVLRLSLRPNGWTWQFHDISGRIVDRGYRSCH